MMVHLFMSHGGRHEQLKKILCAAKFFYFLSFRFNYWQWRPACWEGAVRTAQKRCQGDLLITSRIASFARSRLLFQILYVSNRRTGSALIMRSLEARS